jgi:hypothetical protein
LSTVVICNDYNCVGQRNWPFVWLKSLMQCSDGPCWWGHFEQNHLFEQLNNYLQSWKK